jgi:hypothetical protein
MRGFPDRDRRLFPAFQADGWRLASHPPVRLHLRSGDGDRVEKANLARVVVELAHVAGVVTSVDGLVAAFGGMREPTQEAVVHVNMDLVASEEAVHAEPDHDLVVYKPAAPGSRGLAGRLLDVLTLVERGGQLARRFLTASERIVVILAEVVGR